MFALGSKVNDSRTSVEAYAASENVKTVLPLAVQSLQQLGLSVFPSVLRYVQDEETNYGLQRLPYMYNRMVAPKPILEGVTLPTFSASVVSLFLWIVR
jgi:hypothetical protein